MNTDMKIIDQMHFLLAFREIGCSHILNCKKIISEMEKIKSLNKDKKQLITDLNYIKLVYKYKIDIFFEFLHINNVPIRLEKLLSMITTLEKNNTLKKLSIVQTNFLIEFENIFENFTSYCNEIEPLLAEW